MNTTRATMKVPVRYYLRLADVLARDGLDVAQLMGELGVPSSVLSSPDATLPFSDVDRLVSILRERTDRSDLGFELGKYLTVSSHSIVGFGMLSCSNLAESLRFVARYFRLVMPSFQLRYSIDNDSNCLHFTPVTAMSHACLSFHIEAIAMAAYHEIQELSSGRLRATRISLSIPRPPHAERYERFRQVEFLFGAEAAPGVRLFYEGNLASVPLSLADTNALKMAESRCQAQVAQVARIGEFAEWVEMTIREVSDRLPTLSELAEMLNISTRTLNRYLEREGTSYRALHGKVLHELAKERLAQPNAAVSAVAYSLGFSDPSNFSHAFRRLEGQSPASYQKQLRGH